MLFLPCSFIPPFECIVMRAGVWFEKTYSYPSGSLIQCWIALNKAASCFVGECFIIVYNWPWDWQLFKNESTDSNFFKFHWNLYNLNFTGTSSHSVLFKVPLFQVLGLVYDKCFDYAKLTSSLLLGCIWFCFISNVGCQIGSSIV